uniref:SCP2 domain-containing protein n=1 Tax=Heterorhabditis bacteriophora TaxID=37862 RepID=A0A1I7W9B8_HETBA
MSIFHKKFFLRCLTSNEMHELSRRPIIQIFCISCNRLETVALSTPNCYASPLQVCDGFSSNNDFKASVFGRSWCPRSLKNYFRYGNSVKNTYGRLTYSNTFSEESATKFMDIFSKPAGLIYNISNNYAFCMLRLPCICSRGEVKNPDVVFYTSKTVLIQIVKKDLSPLHAYMKGSLKIQGSIQDALLLKYLADRREKIYPLVKLVFHQVGLVYCNRLPLLIHLHREWWEIVGSCIDIPLDTPPNKGRS